MILKSNVARKSSDYYLRYANNIPGWTKLNKNVLISRWVDHENDELGEYYLAAIIVRYWHLIFKYYKLCPVVPLEEYHTLVLDGILKALSDKAWLNPEKEIFGDPCGPDKCVQRCVKTRVLGYHDYTNRDVRILNTNHISLDNYIEDTEKTCMDFIESDVGIPKINQCYDLIQDYINQGKIFEAVVLDNICFQQSVDQNGFFSIRALTNNLINPTEQYNKYFISSYSKVSDEDLAKVKNTVRELIDSTPAKRHYKLNLRITKLLKSIGNNPELVELLRGA